MKIEKRDILLLIAVVLLAVGMYIHVFGVPL